MRKQSLIHLHGLLVEVTRSLVESGTVSAGVWNEYEALNTSAYAFQAPKGEHKEAVLFLAATLEAELGRPVEQGSAMSV